MRSCAVGVSCLLAACSVQQHFDFDVVVGGNIVSVLGASTNPDCSCDGFRFPTLGKCSYSSDVRMCSVDACQTCFTDIGLEADGVRMATGSAGDGDVVTNGPIPTNADLVLAGCGYGAMRVPLQVDSRPTPTVMASLDLQGVVVMSWTTDVPATAAMASLSETFDSIECLVDSANEFTFPQHGGAGDQVSISSFASTPSYKTPVGTAHVWSGGFGSTTLVYVQPVCEPLTQTGCASGEACSWIIDSATATTSTGHVGCVPAGTKADGAPCTRNPPGATGYDDCMKGDYCVGPATGGVGTCAAICDLAGGSPTCAGAATCSNQAPVFGQSPVAGLCK